MHLKIKTVNQTVAKMYEDHAPAHQGDSGVDVFFIATQTIPAKSTVLVPLGIHCSATTPQIVASGYEDGGYTIVDKPCSYWLIPRSSIYKTPLRMSNCEGLIDVGYRGQICAPLDNISDKDYTIEAGQRLVQLVAPDLSQITLELVDELDETTRGHNGFGSTGTTVIKTNITKPSILCLTENCKLEDVCLRKLAKPDVAGQNYIAYTPVCSVDQTTGKEEIVCEGYIYAVIG
jgi:dUTP pyrophosphatase